MMSGCENVLIVSRFFPVARRKMLLWIVVTSSMFIQIA